MTDLSEREIFARLIESIRTAAGCCQQLAHSRKDSRWLAVRKLLEAMIDRVTLLATRKAA